MNRLGKKPYPLEAEPKWFSDERDGRFCFLESFDPEDFIAGDSTP